MNRLRSTLLLATLLAAAPALAHNGVIHEAPHGGIMKAAKNGHFEVLLAPKGGVRIYFMDPSGRPLPASAASDVSVEIDRPGMKTEYVTMKPDPTSTLWTGDSKPVDDPKSIVRIGSVIRGESALVEIPRSQFPIYGKPEGSAGKGKGKTHAH